MSLQILFQCQPNCWDFFAGNRGEVANGEMRLARTQDSGNLLGQARGGLLPLAGCGRGACRLTDQAACNYQDDGYRPDQLH
ncbi:MAG: hypothetical protein ABR898_17255 [Terracidiphilus sp.]